MWHEMGPVCYLATTTHEDALDKFDAIHRTLLAIRDKEDATARDNGTRALQLVSIAGALMVAGLSGVRVVSTDKEHDGKSLKILTR